MLAKPHQSCLPAPVQQTGAIGLWAGFGDVAKGRMDEDQIQPASVEWAPSKRQADGSDTDQVGAWPQRGVFYKQLGLDRNGRRW